MSSGYDVPDVRIFAHLSDAAVRQLNALAGEQGVSRQALLNRILVSWMADEWAADLYPEPPGPVQVYARIPASQADELGRRARKAGMSLGAAVRDIVMAWLRRNPISEEDDE